MERVHKDVVLSLENDPREVFRVDPTRPLPKASLRLAFELAFVNDASMFSDPQMTLGVGLYHNPGWLGFGRYGFKFGRKP